MIKQKEDYPYQALEIIELHHSSGNTMVGYMKCLNIWAKIQNSSFDMIQILEVAKEIEIVDL